MTAHLELAAIAERLAAGARLNRVERAAAAAVITVVVEHQAARRGRSAARARRDDLIRTLAATFFPRLSRRAQAERIAAAARTYAAAGWIRDRRCATLPERLRGKPEELIWHAFVAHHRFPFGWRQILSILQAKP